MSQATQAQILTDLADLKREVAGLKASWREGGPFDTLEARVEALEKIVASLEKRNEWVVSTYEKNRTPAPAMCDGTENCHADHDGDCVVKP